MGDAWGRSGIGGTAILRNATLFTVLSLTLLVAESLGPSAAASSGSKKCTVKGTPSDDVLRGTEGPDWICGLGGSDRIHGRAGKDRIYGGPGADVVRAGVGDDVVIGGRGRDSIFGVEGYDHLFGEQGADRLNGGPAPDWLSGGGTFEDHCYLGKEAGRPGPSGGGAVPSGTITCP